MRATSRIADVSINTVTKLLKDCGRACWEFHETHFRSIPAHRVQCDEIWAFCYAKKRTVTEGIAHHGIAGDVWTWTALDSDTKLIITWHVTPGRQARHANEFMDDLAKRLRYRIQLTTDGYHPYTDAVELAFGSEVDYTQLIKYKDPEHQGDESGRGAIRRIIAGTPDAKHVSTSFVERQNLTMRMQNRRYTRETNGFSKRFIHHCYMLAIYFQWYNYVRIHQTLGTTPAVAAGLAADPWTMEDIVRLVDSG